MSIPTTQDRCLGGTVPSPEAPSLWTSHRPRTSPRLVSFVAIHDATLNSSTSTCGVPAFNMKEQTPSTKNASFMQRICRESGNHCCQRMVRYMYLCVVRLPACCASSSHWERKQDSAGEGSPPSPQPAVNSKTSKNVLHVRQRVGGFNVKQTKVKLRHKDCEANVFIQGAEGGGNVAAPWICP